MKTTVTNKSKREIKGISLFCTLIILPFIFVIIGTIFYPHQMLNIIQFALAFFIIWIIIVGITSLVLVLINNWHLKHKNHLKTTYNRSGVIKKERLLNHYFQQKYGDDLQDIDNYSVAPDNNIPLNKFMHLYKEKRIDKRDGN